MSECYINLSAVCSCRNTDLDFPIKSAGTSQGGIDLVRFVCCSQHQHKTVSSCLKIYMSWKTFNLHIYGKSFNVGLIYKGKIPLQTISPYHWVFRKMFKSSRHNTLGFITYYSLVILQNLDWKPYL